MTPLDPHSQHIPYAEESQGNLHELKCWTFVQPPPGLPNTGTTSPYYIGLESVDYWKEARIHCPRRSLRPAQGGVVNGNLKDPQYSIL